MNTFFFTLSISLFDSLSTTQQIIIFILLLTTAKPIRNVLCYLVGLIAAYAACGIAGYGALDKLQVFLARYFPSSANIPGHMYYQSELWAGIVMTLLGFWYYNKKKNAKPGRTQNFVLKKLKSMNGVFAFGIGVFVSVTSFPLSLPYIAALGKYALLHVSLTVAIAYILLYNIGYALPMIVILGMYLIARRNVDYDHDALHEKARKLNVQLTTWALAGVGVFSIIDAGWFFAFGHALLKGRYF